MSQGTQTKSQDERKTKPQTEAAQDYRDSLNLPKTDFAMKANLPNKEPKMLEEWDKQNLYQKIRQARAGRKKWVLHDGPPYANGNLHLGHAVNKILKDVIVKSASLSGFDAPYVPGWDCHGLPIEVKVEQKLGRPRDDDEKQKFRQACRDYAKKWIGIQREEFKRMGIIGDWDEPYITMDYQIEADIVRALAEVYKNGHVVPGYKPVNWCLDCQSALAEAEIEYKDKISSGITVGFPLPAEQEAEMLGRAIARSEGPEPQGNKQKNGEGEILFVIWTTTPWTIPSNLTVTLNPEMEYSLIQTEAPAQVNAEHDNRGKSKKLRLLLASNLHQKLMEKYGLPHQGVIAKFKGADLEKLKLKHPYYKGRESLVTLGDYVSDEEGTGMVHSAPAYGLDDFFMGERYKLPLDNPVNDYGKFAKDRDLVGNLHVFKNDAELVDLIRQSGYLLHLEEYKHQYPHCWRHKTPTIYRATRQWFISMTKEDLIGKVLKQTPSVRWTPGWGQNRIELMMKNRPDWCISRQRHWGVPIPCFVHKETGEAHPDTAKIMERVAKLIEKDGIDAWHNLKPEDIANDMLANKDDMENYTKGDHVLDVWFDSGSTHFSVLRHREELSYPATMYLEGSDQHRGWFQSSVLCGVAMDNKAPYKEVLTHGFTVDSEGHKMSKSLGNIIEPSEVINRLGADVLRWWVVSSDYANEMVISQDILNSSADIYRKIRNTIRFMLANLHDFTPDEHSVASAEMLSLDKWLVSSTLDLQNELKQLFYDYNFPMACRKIHSFCVRELGGFYLDIIKDRQYTMYKDSPARRSAQSAIFLCLEALIRWITPILSFTAAEAWGYMPGRLVNGGVNGMNGAAVNGTTETNGRANGAATAEDADTSVFALEWFDGLNSLSELDSDFTTEDWQQILNVKEQINRILEEKRNEGIIGSGLEAEVNLICSDELYQLLDKLGDELKYFFISSKANLIRKSGVGDGSGSSQDVPRDSSQDLLAQASPTDLDSLSVFVRPVTGKKCVRCWHRFDEDDRAIGNNPQHPDICDRCVSNLTAPGETRHHG